LRARHTDLNLVDIFLVQQVALGQSGLVDATAGHYANEK
jgi:hypothetical protein